MSRLLVVLCSGLLALIYATPALAQWSSDIGGVPRAGVPRMATSQSRFEFDLSGFKLPGAGGDTTAVRLRMGAGWSWRIASVFEFGVDLTFVQGEWVNPPSDATLEPGDVFQVAGLYGGRFGLKFRPISYLDLDGNGIEAALGIGYQPEVAPVITHRIEGDSTTTGGIVGDVGEDDGIGKVHSAFMYMAALSYRSPRLLADLAIVGETGDEDSPSALTVYSGLSVRAGLRYRLTHSIALGASFWGEGAPPWRDRLARGVRASDGSQLAVWLSLGGKPEGAFNVTVDTPTGAFGESATLYMYPN